MSTRHVAFLLTFAAVIAAPLRGQWQPSPYTSGPIYFTGGNTGVGTSSPVQKLDVEGAANNGSPTTVLRIGTNDIAYGGSGGALELAAMNNRGAADPVARVAAWLTNGTANAQAGDLVFYTATAGVLYEHLRVTSNGTVNVTGSIGVGTTSPAQKLDIEGAAFNGAPTTLLRIGTNDIAYGGSGGAIELTAMNNRGAADPVGKIAAWLTGGVANQQAGDLVFYTATAGALNEHLRVTGGGVVTVTGNIVASGTISGAQVIGATYQDIAEWVPASEAMAPGTVVVIEPRGENGVRPSTRAYDTSVAGVVSAKPGVILGVAGPAKEQIATTGRVKVRVDASRAAIQAGDLLVTSDKPGMAMRSEPIEFNGRRIHQPGTIIGKALQPLAGGEGEILVLLSLQ
ncbi:MAG TPA: hypothetical protein VJZ76_07150 [Thermoanaerobaculia bacterium]|nr:hypothetical protein [Thermoanaerobaculia bacterium]